MRAPDENRGGATELTPPPPLFFVRDGPSSCGPPPHFLVFARPYQY